MRDRKIFGGYIYEEVDYPAIRRSDHDGDDWLFEAGRGYDNNDDGQDGNEVDRYYGNAPCHHRNHGGDHDHDRAEDRNQDDRKVNPTVFFVKRLLVLEEPLLFACGNLDECSTHA